MVSPQLGTGNLDDLPDSVWGTYSEAQNLLIEEAWQSNQAMVELDVGIRNFQIIFDGRKFSRRGGTVQYDPVNHKLRHVRRREVSIEERVATSSKAAQLTRRVSEESCAICMQRFAANSAIPVVNLQCGHSFHGVCAQHLADTQQDCPLCRRSVVWADVAGLTPQMRSQSSPVATMGGAFSLGVAGSPGGGRSAASSLQSSFIQSGRRVSWADGPLAIAAPPQQGLHPGNDQGLWLLLRAQQGNTEEVRRFLSDGVNINYRSPGGATPLISAAGAGHASIVSLLLSEGADIHLATSRGNSALRVAVSTGQREVARILHQRGGT